MSSSYQLVTELNSYVGKTVELKGWLYNQRSSGSIAFLQFRDGTGSLQIVVVKNQVDASSWAVVKSLTLESSISVTGIVKEDKRAPSGLEIEASSILLIQAAPDDYPIGKKEHGPAFLLKNRHLWLRTPRQQAIQRIRNEIIKAIYDFYYLNHFTKIDTPIFTPNACEGTTTLFEVNYFGEPAYLSQSGQLYLEALISSLGRVFDFSPVFRAEKSKTKRHLTEFWMTNAEMAFFDHEANMQLQEELILHILKHVLTHSLTDFAILERNTEPLQRIQGPFVHLRYLDLIEKLRSLGSDINPGEDLGNDDETLLMNHYKTPVFVEYYPTEVKAFYMKKDPKNPNYVKCADMLAPEGYGEIIGGSERETDYQVLLDSIKKHHLPQKDFDWYLDLRKYGSVVHSGFGLGLERIVAWICKLKHVRETIPFPRMLNHLRP